MALNSGSYTARSLIANAQRCVNLYPEKNPPDAPTKYTHYQRAGLRLARSEAPSPAVAGGRGQFTASNGQLFEVIDNKVYYTSAAATRTLLGTIAAGLTPVSMADNGIVLVLVDGTAAGYVINLSTHAFSAIADPAFYGSTRVGYIDTFFVFNRPGSVDWYISPSDWNGVTAFDPLDFGRKIGNPDNIATLAVNSAQVWLVGSKSAEVWYNVGGADFPFARVPNILIQHGTVAPYSIASNDIATFWLAQDNEGGRFFVIAKGYEVTRISTHAIETEWKKYTVVSDAQTFIYQINGHTFVHVTFPTADKTWVFDESTGMWHEEAWIDTDGIEHRHRAGAVAYAYETNYCADWETGDLLIMDADFYQDVDSPIVYRRGFPHVVKGGKRIVYSKFVANMASGAIEGATAESPAKVYLRWSDDRGQSFGNPVEASLGATGDYSNWANWSQLGMAADRVFEIFWSGNFETALQGAFIDAEATDA